MSDEHAVPSPPMQCALSSAGMLRDMPDKGESKH